MANNRFDTYLPLDLGFQVYAPQEFTPDLSMLDSLLGGLQKEYDTGMSALNRIMPNYLRNSPTDVEAAKQFKSKYDSIIEQTSEAFANGNINEGRRLMSQGLRQIEQDQLPGGDFYELERRVGEYQNEVKRLRELYKDNPRIAEYAIANKIGLTDFRNPETGEAQSIQSASDIYKDVSDKDISAWFNQTLDNIKDTLIQQGWSRNKVDAITTIHDLKTLTGREFSDVMGILVNTFPEEFKQSIAQRYAADKYFNPNLPNIDPTKVFETTVNERGELEILTDDKDRPVFANTPMANMIRGYALAGTRITPKDQLVEDDDEILLENLKHNLRKKEIDYEFNLGNETLRTQVFTKGSGMPELNLTFDKKGLRDERVEMRWSQINKQLEPKTVVSHKPNFKEYIKSEEAEREYPALVDLGHRFNDYIENLSDDKAFDFLVKKYNEKRDALQTADVQYEIYGNPKRLQARREVLIGSVDRNGTGRIGNIRNKTIIVRSEGSEPKAYKFQDFLNQYGITKEEFIGNTSVHGSIRSDNPLVASGEEMSYTREDGTGISFTASDISLEDAQFKSPEYTLHQARAYGGVDKTKSVYIGVPELDQQYGRVYAEGQDLYESDIIAQRMDDFSLPQDELQELADRYAELKDNPNKDTYVGRDVKIISATTGEDLTTKEGLTLDKIAYLKSMLLNEQR